MELNLARGFGLYDILGILYEVLPYLDCAICI